MKSFLLLLMFVINTVVAVAQVSDRPEMADVLRSNGKIYVVIATIAIVFIGLAIYLFTMDHRLKKLEKNS